MEIVAISVGQPQIVQWQDKEIETSIFKSSISGTVKIFKTNIEGDRQSDLKVHGGVDKAVYAYGYDTYSWWEKKLAMGKLPYGTFGENLTLDGLDETKIFVGDVFEIGGCLLEAVQPRQPCFKLAIRLNNREAVQIFNEHDRSGVYFRVKKEGSIQAGDKLKLIWSEKIKASISELFHFYKDKRTMSQARAAELVQIQSLNEKWKSKFSKIAEGQD